MPRNNCGSAVRYAGVPPEAKIDWPGVIPDQRGKRPGPGTTKRWVRLGKLAHRLTIVKTLDSGRSVKAIRNNNCT